VSTTTTRTIGTAYGQPSRADRERGSTSSRTQPELHELADEELAILIGLEPMSRPRGVNQARWDRIRALARKQ
jgi:hypothetical protein